MSGLQAARRALRNISLALVLAFASFSAQIMSDKSTSAFFAIRPQINSRRRRYLVDNIILISVKKAVHRLHRLRQRVLHGSSLTMQVVPIQHQ